MSIIRISLALVLACLGGVIGYKLKSCPEVEVCQSKTVTVIKEKTVEGAVKETVITENKVVNSTPPNPPKRYTVGITTDFAGLGALFTYKPFESVPISVGGYIIPNRSYGLAIVFNF